MTNYKCPLCGFETEIRHNKKRIFCACGGVVANERYQDTSGVLGVGDSCEQVIAELGIKPKQECSCKSLKRRMNKLGVSGCKEERVQLAEKLKNNGNKWSWSEAIAIAAKNATNAMAWRFVASGDVYLAIIDEAIRRSEAGND